MFSSENTSFDDGQHGKIVDVAVLWALAEENILVVSNKICSNNESPMGADEKLSFVFFFPFSDVALEIIYGFLDQNDNKANQQGDDILKQRIYG